MGDVIGADHRLYLYEGAEIDHLTVLVADSELCNVGFIGTGIRLGLEIYPVDLAELVELVHV